MTDGKNTATKTAPSYRKKRRKSSQTTSAGLLNFIIGVMGNDTNQNRGVILPVLHNIFSCVFFALSKRSFQKQQPQHERLQKAPGQRPRHRPSGFWCRSAW